MYNLDIIFFLYSLQLLGFMRLKAISYAVMFHVSVVLIFHGQWRIYWI